MDSIPLKVVTQCFLLCTAALTDCPGVTLCRSKFCECPHIASVCHLEAEHECVAVSLTQIAYSGSSEHSTVSCSLGYRVVSQKAQKCFCSFAKRGTVEANEIKLLVLSSTGLSVRSQNNCSATFDTIRDLWCGSAARDRAAVSVVGSFAQQGVKQTIALSGQSPRLACIRMSFPNLVQLSNWLSLSVTAVAPLVGRP